MNKLLLLHFENLVATSSDEVIIAVLDDILEEECLNELAKQLYRKILFSSLPRSDSFANKGKIFRHPVTMTTK